MSVHRFTTIIDTGGFRSVLPASRSDIGTPATSGQSSCTLESSRWRFNAPAQTASTMSLRRAPLRLAVALMSASDRDRTVKVRRFVTPTLNGVRGARCRPCGRVSWRLPSSATR